MRTYHNTSAADARRATRDIKIFGDGDMFMLLNKASSESEGWMKSTKAMEIAGVGCIVQVTTQQDDQIAEAITFVPGVHISGDAIDGRYLVINDA